MEQTKEELTKDEKNIMSGLLDDYLNNCVTKDINKIIEVGEQLYVIGDIIELKEKLSGK